MCSHLPKFFVRHMKYPTQTNGNDCGIYAIANMVSILHGIDPSGLSFHAPAMRSPLQQGLKNKTIAAFPHRKLASVKHTLYLWTTNMTISRTIYKPKSRTHNS